MLSDPQTLTIGGSAASLPRTTNGATQNSYTSPDGIWMFTVKQNQTAKRFRREVRLSETKVAADPISAVNASVGLSAYIVVDEPRNGVFTDAEILSVVVALKDWLTTANINKVLAGEF